MIGNTIECTCGGGRIEHCVHTIFTLLRVFKIREGDPLLYQLSFIDEEIQNAVPDDPYRFHYHDEPVMPAPRRQNRRDVTREAQQVINQILQEGKEMAEEIRMKDQEATRMKLQEDEQCCICFENLNPDQNMTYCKYGCGRNFHMKCAEHYASHKTSNKQEATCPLCRKSWGPSLKERFKKETRMWKQEQEKRKFEARKNIYSKYNLNARPHGVGSTDRSFICYCCKRSILYDAKFQCTVCIDIEICKICYLSNYHEVHKFIVRPSPDKNWKPAYRETEVKPSKGKQENDGELTIDQFEKLLSEKQRDKFMTMQKYLTLSYEKMFSYPKSIPEKSFCVTCEIEIKQEVQDSYQKGSKKSLAPPKEKQDYFSKALALPCDHLIHKYCLEELFRKKANHCPQCQQVILPGYQSALLTKKLVNSEVLKKKQAYEASTGLQNGNFGAIGVGADLTAKIEETKEEQSEEDESQEDIDVNIDLFLENQLGVEESKDPRAVRVDPRENINNMIAQYNAHQPDLGQRIDPRQEEWIDPSEKINASTSAPKPFRIKSQGRAYKNIASGHQAASNTRAKLEEDRRQMLQYNLPQSQIEEEKKAPVSRRPPRGSSASKKKLRHQPRSLRSKKTTASNNSFLNSSKASNTSYSRVKRSNRVTPPCPVRIPKEVTDGIAFLKAVRMAREGSDSFVTQEESKSPGAYTNHSNVLDNSQIRTRPRSGIRIKKKGSKKSNIREESKLAKDESVLSKQVKDWEITNLLNANQRRRQADHVPSQLLQDQEEEKVPQNDNIEDILSTDFPSDFPPGGHARMEYLRKMERQLFHKEAKPPKHEKNRLKAYKRVRDAASHNSANPGHNFTGAKIKVNQNDTSIEKYLKEIRGEAPADADPFMPDQHRNRVRNLDEQDDVHHPLLSDALAYDSEGRPADAIRAQNRHSNPLPSSQPQPDEYVVPNRDPGQELREEILRNKQAKARLRELQKQADIQRARKNAPLKKYY